MLENLYIKNVALIKEENIDLTSGLNIISGETGAGKSMFIDAIMFMLGSKFSKDFIRHNEVEATVVGTFCIDNTNVLHQLQLLDIEVLDDNMVQIRRVVNVKGKSIVKINGKIYPIGILKEVSKILVDVHLQNEHQNLLSESNHIGFLDMLCGHELAVLKTQLLEKYHEYKEVEKNIALLEIDEKYKNTRIDMLNFQINELTEANLKDNEEEYLATRRKILTSSVKIGDSCENIITCLYDGGEEESAYDMITKSINNAQFLAENDDSQQYIVDKLMDIQANLEDITHDIRSYNDNLEHEPDELSLIEDRLSIIFKLKKKYGNTTTDMIQYLKKVEDELETLENSEINITKLKLKSEEIESGCMIICNQLTSIRKNNIQFIKSNLVNTLVELGMKDVIFDIRITKKEKISQNGIDNVSFLISTNKGQELKPLDKIASGGEMSRIMIAIKNLISDCYDIETFIFDEIDTGVSGRTAQSVGEKLSKIGRNHQIICITHLPQIAAMGNNNIVIAKITRENETITNITKLNETDEILEIARLIGGAKITDATIEAAKEMKQMAQEIILSS